MAETQCIPCPECGAWIESTLTRCPACAAIFPTGAARQARKLERGATRPPRFDLATLVLLLLLAGAIVLMWIVGRAM
jgi:hypothetical protein